MSKCILKLRDFNDDDDDILSLVNEYFYHTLTHCCHEQFDAFTILYL